MTTRMKYNPTLYPSTQGAVTGFPGPANSTLALKGCPGPNLYKRGGTRKRRHTRKRRRKRYNRRSLRRRRKR
jgi:hypothetical protein